MLKALAPVGTREAIDEAKLLEFLLLIPYAYDTDSGISSVAASEHGDTEEELRHTAHSYLERLHGRPLRTASTPSRRSALISLPNCRGLNPVNGAIQEAPTP